MAVKRFKQSSILTDFRYQSFLAGNPFYSLPIADWLVVGGGGGGGNTTFTSGAGGGGGAGGYRTGSSYTLPATFTVTVGAGGSNGLPGSNGSDSVFSIYTSSGGGRGSAN